MIDIKNNLYDWSGTLISGKSWGDEQHFENFKNPTNDKDFNIFNNCSGVVTIFKNGSVQVLVNNDTEYGVLSSNDGKNFSVSLIAQIK